MVYFVGAGSGALDLITIRGMEVLKKADLIIFAGSLVNHEFLDFAKPDAKCLDSAKMTLEEVVSEIIIAEGKNFMTVRLHTGDPSLYGAIKEQMDFLSSHKINFEIVPGVSSFCAAAASLKVEYTLPSVSQTLIITRLEGKTPVPELEMLSNLAKHNTSMAIFLSIGMADKLEQELLKSYPEDTPSAIVYKASWPDEKIFRCTVSKIKETVKKNNITKTALVLIGKFLDSDYERSKLYDPSFSTEYRKATHENS